MLLFTMKPFRFLFLFTAVIALNSCDIVDGPYSEGANQAPDTTVTYVKKILIEDYTGHTCGNCPLAAIALGQVHDLYGSQIVSMGVHAGGFATPAGSHFPADYRNEVSIALDEYFNVSAVGNPNGILNRRFFNNDPIVGHTDWATKASQLVTEPAEAWLTITPGLNLSSRQLTVEVNSKILLPLEEGLSMVVYLTEDSIFGPQKYYGSSEPGEIVENYCHRHVLRGSMNGIWGNPLSAATSFAAGSETNSTFSYTLPVAWNSAKVHVLAVLYRTSTKEVVQVEEKKIY